MGVGSIGDQFWDGVWVPHPCLVANSGCASGVGAFAGNRLQGAHATEAGRKAIRSAPRAEP